MDAFGSNISNKREAPFHVYREHANIYPKKTGLLLYAKKILNGL